MQFRLRKWISSLMDEDIFFSAYKLSKKHLTFLILTPVILTGKCIHFKDKTTVWQIAEFNFKLKHYILNNNSAVNWNKTVSPLYDEDTKIYFFH